MKRFIQSNLILLILISFFMISCDGPEDPIPIPDPDQQTVEVKGTLNAFAPVENYNKAGDPASNFAQLDGSGEIELKGLGPDRVEVRHSHIAILREDGNIKFQNGEFFFQGSGDDTLFGSYEGSGRKLDEGFEAEFLLTIKGGTGKYAEATGRIREIIELRAGNGNKVYDIYFNGNISLPGEVQLNKIYM